jgi:hypothetical protein
MTPNRYNIKIYFMINLIILILYCRIFIRFLEDAIPKERKHVGAFETKERRFPFGRKGSERWLMTAACGLLASDRERELRR